MNAIFLPLLSSNFVFLSPPAYRQEIMGGHIQEANDIAGNLGFAFSATSLNENSDRVFYKTHDVVHDHNNQAIPAPKRKKWRIPKHRAVHSHFNFPKTKVSLQSQKEARIFGRRGREPRYNPKAHRNELSKQKWIVPG